MKKIYLTACLSLMLSISMAQNVAEIQTPLVVKKTATWCTPCGTWGWELFEEVWDEVAQESVILEMHNSSSSGLYSSAAYDFYGLHEQRSSTPVFYVNTLNEVEYASGGGIYTGATKDNIINAVNATTAQSPVVNSGFNQTISGNTLTVDTKVKFFENTSGEYYLGVYVTEDNVQAGQSGISGTATHKRIMRASVHPNIEGTLVSSGTVSAGDEFTDTHTFTLNSSWNADYIKVFTVIWKKVGTQFEYVNAHQVQGFASSEEFTANDLDVRLFPNIASSHDDIHLQINGAANEKLTITVYDQVGKKVSDVFNGELTSNNETFNLNTDSSIRKGVYLVSILTENKMRKTIKMIVR